MEIRSITPSESKSLSVPGSPSSSISRSSWQGSLTSAVVAVGHVAAIAVTGWGTVEGYRVCLATRWCDPAWYSAAAFLAVSVPSALGLLVRAVRRK